MHAQLLTVMGLLLVAGQVAPAAGDSAARVLGTVNGRDLTQADLETAFIVRRVPPERQPQFRDEVLNDVVDRMLMAEFLDARKIDVPASALHARMELLQAAVEAGGSSLSDVLARLSLSEDSLRDYLALPLRWKAFVRRSVSDQELKQYFEANRARFDGTKVRVRQIVLSVPSGAEEAEWQAAETRLKGVRQSIIDGASTFEDAARKHSTSPSGKQGGDVGFVTFRGQLPPEVSEAAFALPAKEVSDVIRSAFGVHIVEASERKPGDYSLEDVREEVWDRRTQEMWDEQVAQLRQAARIRIAPAQ